MTEGQTATRRAARKAGDADFLRAVAEAVVQLLTEGDVEGPIGGASTSRSGPWAWAGSVRTGRVGLFDRRAARGRHGSARLRVADRWGASKQVQEQGRIGRCLDPLAA